jgi:hypothetical protein
LCPGRIFKSGVEIEFLDPFLLLSGLQAPEQVADLLLCEPREGQVVLATGLQVGKESREEPLVPGA